MLTTNKSVFLFLFTTLTAWALTTSAVTTSVDVAPRKFVQIAAKTKFERTQISNLGVAIEEVRTDSVWGFANETTLKLLNEYKIKILGEFPIETARGGHQNLFGFPPGDA